MKNLVLLICVAFFATTSYGQLRVTAPNGFTIINDDSGNLTPEGELHVEGLIWNNGGTTTETTGVSATTLVNRTDGSVMLFGAGVNSGFSFDNSTNFNIRANTRAALENRALTTGPLAFFIQGSTQRIGIRNQNPSASLHVTGNVFASGQYQGSDKALKSNLKSLEYGLDEIMDLNTYSYFYKPEMGFDDDKIKFGVVAQEMQKVMPELVSTFNHERYTADGAVIDAKDYLQIDAGALQYVLVNAIKDQQAMIEAQAEKIAQLEEAFTTIGTIENTNRSTVTLSSYDLAELGQNTPNPFNGVTNISYVIPTNATSAQISIFGTSGQLLKSLDIEHTGKGTLEVNAQDLPSGTYSYQLIVDGRPVGTNQMISAK